MHEKSKPGIAYERLLRFVESNFALFAPQAQKAIDQLLISCMFDKLVTGISERLYFQGSDKSLGLADGHNGFFITESELMQLAMVARFKR